MLSEAANKKNLLTNRLKFLSISSSNLDEFYMARYVSSSSLHKAEIHKMVERIKAMQQQIWRELKSELSTYSINIINPDHVSSHKRSIIYDYFINHIKYHIKIIDINRILQALPNLQIVALLRSTDQYKIIIPFQNTPRLAKITNEHFIFAEDIIKIFVGKIIGLIRVTRDTNIYSEQHNEKINQESIIKLVNDKYRGDITSIQLHTKDESLRNLLKKSNPVKIYDIEQTLDLSSVYEIAGALQAKFVRGYSLPAKTYKCFQGIDSKDVLLHHPYRSFGYVLNFLRQAAEDPEVISIKQTIYRTEKNAIDAAAYAAQLGKEVTVIIESRARFDELNNIKLAEYLRKAGAKVILNTSGIKIHSKFCLITKKHKNSIKYYLHYSTGNYNAITATTYQDLSVLTANQELCQDIEKIFSYLTKESQTCELNKIYISPFNLRDKLISLIEQEINYAKSGISGSIWIKCNAITDRKIINLLCQASQNGVKIHVVARGICLLKPSMPGLSENIKIRSIIGDVLEHSRIYCVGNGSKIPSEQTKIYISSADLMERNFEERIETLIPIEDKKIHHHILYEIMARNISSSKKCWELSQDGTYSRLSCIGQSIHEYFFARYREQKMQ